MNSTAPSYRAIGWQLGNPLAIIGSIDSLPGHALHEVNAAVRVRGSIIVADGGSSELRYFDTDGRLRLSRGRNGSGPGEFGYLLAAWSGPGDTIVAWDGLLQRASYWSPSGEFGRTFRFAMESEVSIIGPFADGSLLGMNIPPNVQVPSGTTRYDSVTVLSIPPDGDSITPIGRHPARPVFAISNPALGGANMYIPVPFAPSGEYAVGPSYFYFGYGDKWKIIKFTPSGDPVDTVSREGTPVPLAPEIVERWKNDLLDRAPRRVRVVLRDLVRQYPYPETLPTYDSLVVDDLEYLWVRHYVVPHADSAVWSIFSPVGDWVGDMTLSARVVPTQIGSDFMVAVILDEDAVEMVKVFPLRR